MAAEEEVEKNYIQVIHLVGQKTIAMITDQEMLNETIVKSVVTHPGERYKSLIIMHVDEKCGVSYTLSTELICLYEYETNIQE